MLRSPHQSDIPPIVGKPFLADSLAPAWKHAGRTKHSKSGGKRGRGRLSLSGGGCSKNTPPSVLFCRTTFRARARKVVLASAVAHKLHSPVPSGRAAATAIKDRRRSYNPCPWVGGPNAVLHSIPASHRCFLRRFESSR